MNKAKNMELSYIQAYYDDLRGQLGEKYVNVNHTHITDVCDSRYSICLQVMNPNHIGGPFLKQPQVFVKVNDKTVVVWFKRAFYSRYRRTFLHKEIIDMNEYSKAEVIEAVKFMIQLQIDLIEVEDAKGFYL